MGKLICFSILFLFTVNLSAQETTTTTGGNASGSGGSASYSIGQVFYTLNTGSSATIWQGVQQPFEISVVISSVKEISLKPKLSVYPIPTSAFLKLRVDDYDITKLSFKLIDMNGKIHSTTKPVSSVSLIPVAHLAKGVYFVNVLEGSKCIKSFKIIKN